MGKPAMLKRKNAFIKPSTAKPKAKAKAKNEAKPKGKAKASGKDANEKGEPKAPAQVNLTIEALKQGAYPASIMRNRFFNGSKHEFDTALAEGDIYETTGKDDKVMYAFNTMTVGIEQEKRTDHKVTAKKSIDKNTFQELMAAYHNVGWKFSKKQAEAMVDDEGVMAGAALTLVDQALASLDKINKETGALLKSKQPFEKEMLSSLKQGYAKSTGFVALHAQKLNKKVEEAKGHLRANSK
eukprot:s6911_g2.t1